MKNRAVFLDRDGVINGDSPDYIKTVAEFVLYPKTAEAIAMFFANGYLPVIITNQSGVHRGFLTEKTLSAIHRHLTEAVQDAGGRITGIYFCPHLPEEGCLCRKPRPKMVLDAQQAHDIDLSASIMIGDSAKDIECGIRAGVGKTILVKTGNGEKAQQELTAKGIRPDFVVQDLYAAALLVCGKKG